MKIQTHYFDKPGPENTEECIQHAKEASEMLKIQTVLIATTTGKTGLQAVEALNSQNVIVVTHASGFREVNHQELLQENRERIEALGGRILTCQHALAGISRAVRFKFKTIEIDEIIANSLRIFGQGLKVAVEISMMAADAGLIRTDEDVIAIGGTDSGADTAAIIRPANVSRFFDLKVRAFICKPLNP
jgi:hypothetical protein